ncbi:hypothetical protein CLAFUW4_10157 [Fulvia fulva]|uniref:Uncharacterized protein n=1 Tax=Passalora fulva TaxID=5499 RepID=A0A9Q8LGA0_PASFU|nr:uncharacterized protein CLAFUR5_04770 [Fulvia fulva]KAK4615994.1 hypothetical protein CLAFUR4_10161 [Fulvia fulva]KAK4616643.1 hypothetical protein CLAFUR0_10159 [Fulvia fulva]UJO16894.1 hypothetical protein CLAFUR5_04770 [Fulvia fulva]WPV19562.1 hypothetical protein CLAFUW4_10157 [Fulvia fulva]WPV33755.1 hypothetical protein CLAFUW7_10157 [Fulvia fulva]
MPSDKVSTKTPPSKGGGGGGGPYGNGPGPSGDPRPQMPWCDCGCGGDPVLKAQIAAERGSRGATQFSHIGQE